MQRLRAKICGLSGENAVISAIEGGADYLGFVFFPLSPRNVSPQRAAALVEHIPSGIATVAVTVDADDTALDAIFHAFTPAYLQLHGRETPERIRAIKARHPGIRIIKALALRRADDIAQAGIFYDSADALLFDAKAPSSSPLPGGNGLAFDWQMLHGRSFPLPWFLSGGLNAENLREAVRISGARYIDVSSSLEIQAGVKAPALVRAFLSAANAIELS